ncbi:MAG: hypothetical protein QOI04_489 [Verrucomicrobiota bacterium]|jgi:hypothetical protein
MPSAYRVAPLFLIRMAGVPFDVLERFATRSTAQLARELIASPDQLTPSAAEFEKLSASLDRDLAAARVALYETASDILPHYLVFGSGDVALLLSSLLSHPREPLAPRNSKAFQRERPLLLYLQRVAAKNDTFSRFGPGGWGKIDNQVRGIKIDVQTGIAARETFLERWTAHAVAAAMNADPEIFAELSPRLNPNGALKDQTFVSLENGETISLAREELAAVQHCDGKTPVHAIPNATEIVRALAEKKILRCAVEVPALEPHAFDLILNDVKKWRTGPSRDKWLSILQPLANLAQKFANVTEPQDRHKILQQAREQLRSLGATREPGKRFLYSATNPIGEECFRECGFAINEELINEVAIEAAPWIDLWRDSFAFVAGRVAAGLRQIFEKAAGKNDALPLPAFLRACEMAKLPLTGPGLVGLAVMAFQEVKAAFREQLKGHENKADYELRAEDCHFLRAHFQYAKFDEYTYPSADLQIAAASTDAIASGDYKWILGELHPPAALLHHCMYWACPDKAALNAAFVRVVAGKPSFHFGFFAADFTAHTAVRLFDALPQFANFVAPHCGNPDWRTIRPADAEVYVDLVSGDVCLRKAGTREYLGSFARAWIIPLGFHPFNFSLGAHTPRLRCGKVVVQRRAWTVARSELAAGDFTGVSRDLVVAMERLRAQKDWPRFVYIRPTEAALRRSGAEGRDKDTKPVFIDLESYLFLEIFYRWLTKAGELEVTEMLPAPDDLPWREADGRRTFELRTLIVPHE